MNHAQEAMHIRSLFQQLGNDDAAKLVLVEQIRGWAIAILEPTKAKVPRDFSEGVIAAYAARGIGLEWDLTTTDAYAFCGMAEKVGLAPRLQNVAVLLFACTEALELNALPDSLQQNILDAYAGLDSDLVVMGKSHSKAQRDKATRRRGKVSDDGETIGDIIGKLALSREHGEEGANGLWPLFYAKLEDLELEPREDAEGAFIEYDFKDSRKKITRGHFSNVVSKHRREEKSG